MKIAFVIPSLHLGGAERVMSVLMNGFVEQFQTLEIHLILYGKQPTIFYNLSSKIVIHKADFIFDKNRRLLSTLKTILYLRKTLIKLNADSILSFGEHWNNLVLLAGLGKNFSVFVSDRCQPNKSLGKFQNLLRIWLYPKSKGVIAQTMQAKSIFHTMYEHENIGVIGNPISVKPKVEFLERENIVLSVGRLITSKHQEELIRLFVEIGKSDWKLVIVGGDALKQKNHSKLANLITELGIQNRVILTGAIKDVGFWYERASVFAFTSSSEGFPNVIGEALSYGVPVISFDCVAGPSDMITDGFNGYLVELFDFDMFRVRLAKLMDDESIRQKMSINAPRSVLKFEESMMVQNFFKFIT